MCTHGLAGTRSFGFQTSACVPALLACGWAAEAFLSRLACLPASSTNGSDGRSALEACMSKWVERQMEVRTAYDIRLTTAALAGLLACPHGALDAIQVGRLLEPASAWWVCVKVG
jgi:hypothetical protein